MTLPSSVCRSCDQLLTGRCRTRDSGLDSIKNNHKTCACPIRCNTNMGITGHQRVFVYFCPFSFLRSFGIVLFRLLQMAQLMLCRSKSDKGTTILRIFRSGCFSFGSNQRNNWSTGKLRSHEKGITMRLV